MLGVCAALFQAVGMIFAKPAMGPEGVDPLAATFIRAIFGGAAYWIISLVRGRLGVVLQRASNRQAMKFITVGAFFGPSFGVWFMMLAIKYAPIGIASTIMALMPVTILPFAAIFYREKITWRMIIGAIVACLGVAILFNT
jgi:drug/metabolite transporter (DMT)-like permease